MLENILFALWFFAPAGAANVMPIFVAKVPPLSKYDAPIDGGLMFRGQRVLGSHKTWRGLIAGIITSTLALWLQQLLVVHFGWFAKFEHQVDYATLPILLAGPLFGIGALGGDALKSFFKRQLHIAPGKSWFPFDQIDYIVGGAIATMPFVSLIWWQYAWILVVWLVIHVASTITGYFLGLKDSPV
ncbi:MAG TPA: CDP-archaeol synthase [Candidatus Saccharimonadales bacterium]